MSPQPIPAGTTLIIRGGRAMLPLADWHEPDALDIAIAGDTIAGIAPDFAAIAGAPIEELDARGYLVLPGFVNAHYHSHDVLATEAGAEGARLGHAIGRIAPGYKADLTLIDTSDPTWSPLNSAVRQLVHVEAGRGVRHVIVDGIVVLRDRRLTTIDEDEIYDEVEAVMPGFRRDFAVISERVKRLQPWLDAAHQRMVSTELEFDRIYIPF